MDKYYYKKTTKVLLYSEDGKLVDYDKVFEVVDSESVNERISDLTSPRHKRFEIGTIEALDDNIVIKTTLEGDMRVDYGEYQTTEIYEPLVLSGEEALKLRDEFIKHNLKIEELFGKSLR